MIFALAGNQNCGKTTLFNQLTGSNQHVGNFPGVTVDSKEGVMRGAKGCSVVDLPGIYSLRPYTAEEIVTRDFILNQKPDGIINIVDATNIERNLYLTLQLLEMQIPMVLALNMMDEVRGNGGTIDVQKMSDELGIPVVPIAAAKNEGIEDLVESAVRVAHTRTLPKRVDFCDDGPVHRCIHAVSHLIEDHAQAAGMARRFAATKLIEGDEDIISRLLLNQNELEMVEHSIVEMEDEGKLDRNAAIASMRYDYIERLCSKTVVKCRESREHLRSVRIDRVLTNKYAALPIFVGIMLLINIIKVPWGRARMRLIYSTGNDTYFSNWWQAGTALKKKLVADGVSSDDFRSFPSGHTACAACSMLLILLPTLYRRLHDKEKLFMVLGGVWTLAVAVSRLRMGMHFLSDVSVSSLLTIALGAVAVWLFYFNKPFFNKIWAFASGDPKPAKKPRTPEEP